MKKGMRRMIIILGVFLAVLFQQGQQEMVFGEKVSLMYEDMGYLLSYRGQDSNSQLGVRFYPLNNNISYYGLKYRSVIRNLKNGNLFWGAEVDFLPSFKGEISKGKGWLGYISVGGHFSLARNIRLVLEIGPGFLYLKDEKTKISIKNFDPGLINAGIGFYF